MASAPSTPKAGWEVKTLGEACEMYQPKTISKKEMDPNGEFPVFGANGIIGRYSKFNHEDPELLITCRGATCGAVNVSLPRSWINGNAMVVRPKSDSLKLTFLKYLFTGGHLVEEAISGAAQPQITRTSLKPLQIPVPPLAEQERIVGILDEAFEGIAAATAQAEKNLHNARELFQSVLQSTFSQKGDDWVETTLGEMAIEFGRGKSKHRPRNADFLYGGKYPFIQTGDIRNSNHLIAEYTQTYSEEGLSQSKLWPEGTVCITIAANIAETGILSFDACFPDSVIGMIPDPEKSVSGYVEYLIQFFKVELQRQGKGSAQDNLNLGTFKAQTFPFAPVAQQQAIVEKLDALSEETKALEAIYERKQSALAELKQSLLQKAFAGEL
jgi:type I restriction enzyme S subunit